MLQRVNFNFEYDIGSELKTIPNICDSFFSKIVSGFQSVNVSAKNLYIAQRSMVIDIWHSPKYAFLAPYTSHKVSVQIKSIVTDVVQRLMQRHFQFHLQLMENLVTLFLAYLAFTNVSQKCSHKHFNIFYIIVMPFCIP